MFNSQKINTDPEPWTQKWLDGIVTRHKCMGQTHNRWRYQPRPEFDNTPNPVLVAFREIDAARACSTTGHSATLELQRMAWDAERDAYTYWHDLPEIPTHAQMTHARKVLERLAALA